MQYRSIIITSFLGFVLLLISCSTGDPVDEKTDIIATVGSFEIRDVHFQNDLKQFYNRSGRALNLNNELRKSVVESRLNRYAIVEFAREKNWHETPAAIYERELIRRKALMEEFQRKVIEAEVDVTENDLRTLFYRVNTSVRASHLFAKNRKKADSLYNELMNGADFEELASDIFESPSLANSGGDLGYFTVDDMDMGFEDMAYQLEPGEFSKPVKTSHGYSIIKVTDVLSTPLITETEFIQKKRELETLAYDQKRELAIREHMRQVINSFNFNEILIADLWNYIENSSIFHLADHSTEDLMPELDTQLLNEVIADNGITKLTVQDFLDEAYYTPQPRRQNAREFWQFREQIDGLAYRFHVLREIQDHPDFNSFYVERTVEETFYDYLIDQFDSYLESQVTFSEQELRKSFEANRKLYADPLELNLAEIIITDSEDAEQAYRELQANKPFRDVLETYTADREAIEYGGELGFIPITHFGTATTSVRNLQPGEFSEPVQLGARHFVIFKCIGRKESKPVTFQEGRHRVDDHLRSMAVQNLRKEKIEDAKQKFNATIFTEKLNNVPLEL